MFLPSNGHDRAFALQGAGLFQLGDGVADVGPADQKSVQGVVDLVDLTPETFKRLILFWHERTNPSVTRRAPAALTHICLPY
jgi:hypothetical protein